MILAYKEYDKSDSSESQLKLDFWPVKYNISLTVTQIITTFAIAF